MKNRKFFILLFIISGIIFFLSRCINNVEKSNDSRGNVYAGSLSCRQCHQSIYDSYFPTSHHDATQVTSEKGVYGSFSAGRNTFLYDSSIKIVMEHRDSGLFEVAYVNGRETAAHRFDIIFGKKHAETFLFWKGTKFFELPISYYTSIENWATSPGFSAKEPYFSRSIGTDCFECHSSFINSKSKMSSAGTEEEFDKSSLVYGIDCERCHGPAINHVNYQLAYPDSKEAKYIVTSHSLSRQQKLDECAVCHSGNDKQKEISTFKFKMGDTLANFFSPWASSRHNDSSDFDVHGNQYQLLSQSKCYLTSKTLTCITCHNPHTNASNNLKEYSQKCLSCHQNTDHTSKAAGMKSMNEIKNNCIDCHMPMKASEAITFHLSVSGDKSSYMLRTHKIAIYSAEAAVIKDFVLFYNKNKG